MQAFSDAVTPAASPTKVCRSVESYVLVSTFAEVADDPK